MTTQTITDRAPGPSTASTAPTPTPAATPAPTPAATSLYGPRGWTVRSGLCELLGAGRIASAATDFLPTGVIDHTQAAAILDLIPPANLADRQNLAPSCGQLLRACVAAQGRIYLTGYLIGPGRVDERLSLDGLLVRDYPDYTVSGDHHSQCQCDRLFADLITDYGISDWIENPDEVYQTVPDWDPDHHWWRLWWD